MKQFAANLRLVFAAVMAAVLAGGCVANPMAESRVTVADTGANDTIRQQRATRSELAQNETDASQRRNQRATAARNTAPMQPPAAPDRPVAGYHDPELPAMDVVYVGAGTFLNEETNSSARDSFETQLFAALGGKAGQAELGRIAQNFFQRVAVANPGLRIRVADPAQRKLLGETINNTAFASIGFNDAVVFQTQFAPSATDRTLYVSLPLFLVSAKSYQLIYCRPLFIRVRIEEGVSPADPEISRRVLTALREALDSTVNDPRSGALVAQALKRGAFRDPNRLIYGVDEGAVTFSERASAAETGFGDCAKVSAILREAASDYLACADEVFPPIHARLSEKLYRDLGAAYYGLEVVTDMNMPQGFPVSDSGRIILPISRVPEDVNLGIYVKTGTRDLDQGTMFKTGLCQILLEVAKRNARNDVLERLQFIKNGEFEAHVSQTGRVDEECLMETLLACAEQFKNGLK